MSQIRRIDSILLNNHKQLFIFSANIAAPERMSQTKGIDSILITIANRLIYVYNYIWYFPLGNIFSVLI